MQRPALICQLSLTAEEVGSASLSYMHLLFSLWLSSATDASGLIFINLCLETVLIEGKFKKQLWSVIILPCFTGVPKRNSPGVSNPVKEETTNCTFSRCNTPIKSFQFRNLFTCLALWAGQSSIMLVSYPSYPLKGCSL